MEDGGWTVMELDGLPVQAADLVPLATHNYGHFTTMCVENMRVRGLALHLERLLCDSGRLFGHAVDPERVVSLIRHALGCGPHGGPGHPTMVRVTVFAPDFDPAHPGKDAQPAILVTTRPAPAPEPAPARLMTTRYTRVLAVVKHVGLFGQLHQRRQAQVAGFDDVLFVGEDATVLEGATWNIGFIDGGRVIWPESDSLPGVTMRVIQESLRRDGVESLAEPVDLAAAAGMEAAFMTNAAIGVRAIASIDEHIFAADTLLLARLARCYRDTPGEGLFR
jgi:branched-subunit amino acid aminotransferase/4-amino-4-deoxychorismate lyase